MTTEFNLKGKPINTKDIYYIENSNGLILFYKNNVLHRELGPAVFYEEEKDKYFNLGDENLYSIETPKFNIINLHIHLLKLNLISNTHDPLYYINGQEYTVEEFNSILEKKILYNELKDETPKPELKDKKIKV